ncbi:MAG: hypothetical protein AAB268_00780 [Elusimicrobiota bacterium]
MAKLNAKEIRDAALKIILKHPGGIRYTDLVGQIAATSPETPKNTINGSVWDLEVRRPADILKPTRGLYLATRYADKELLPPELPANKTGPKLREEDFYELFADYLKGDLNEVKKVIALGGGGLKAKWGTPDVLGVYKSSGADLVKFADEIVSAEIKIDPLQPVVAFGQAAAYRLFSNRVYVVMPSIITKEDQDRLEALCMLYGIGLILFDLNLKEPGFSIRVRAQRFQPDMFYVNEFARNLHKHSPEKFEELFG